MPGIPGMARMAVVPGAGSKCKVTSAPDSGPPLELFALPLTEAVCPAAAEAISTTAQNAANPNLPIRITP